MSLPLPVSTVQLLEKARLSERHPGLQLDKFIRPCPRQEQQKASLAEVCQTTGDTALLISLLQHRAELLKTISAVTWRCTTAGPLTLHLSRASALENAGICLHPLYGFVFLPGTGLKGMARAYAETVWLPAQADRVASWRQIEDVLGWAPNPDRRRQIQDKDHPAVPRRQDNSDPASAELIATCGSVVFHDAWPETWPKLVVDIVNNHHTEYYGANPDDNDRAAGDWEMPNMVSFLAIGPGTRFSFALSKRRSDTDIRLLSKAREWLMAALVHTGAGAKTAAGYGGFQLVDEKSPKLDSPARRTLETMLELVTPAFFAGANQKAEDCELRPATLRSLLRWWWRTIHSGYVNVARLRSMEAAVWGDTNAGGPIRISVTPVTHVEPVPYDKRLIAEKNLLPQPPNRKTTQGLWYHSYGMDESKGQRFFIAPNARWLVRLTARASYFRLRDAQGGQLLLEPQIVLDQASAALWLLCHFGGIGSKARKGFGCFSDPKELPGLSLEKCQEFGRNFRGRCNLTGAPDANQPAPAPSLERLLSFPDIPTPWTNAWFALDRVGDAAQSFAQLHKHNLEKKALGLPRRVRPPYKGSFQPGPHVQKTDRHASPVFYHLTKGSRGTLTIRVAAFPAAELPDDPSLAKSRQFLNNLLAHLKTELQAGIARHQSKGRTAEIYAPPPKPPQLPTSGARIEAILSAEKTKAGGWKALHEPTGMVGEIQNSTEVPSDKKAGEKVPLIVAFCSTQRIAFRWPNATDLLNTGKHTGGQSQGRAGNL